MSEMRRPERIPIAREEGYCTHYVGTYEGRRQFMGFVVAALKGFAAADWEAKKRWYAVLYTFSRDGELTDVRWEFFGTTADGEETVVEKARGRLEEWLGELKGIAYCDVAVKPFRLEIEGNVFGLVSAAEAGCCDDEADNGEQSENMYLVPNDLMFYPPWTGEYDT